MGQRVTPKKVWKKTHLMVTHELEENVIREIIEHSHWSVDTIRCKLFDNESLIRIPGARFHVYRENLSE